jgi:hypothetical protein
MEQPLIVERFSDNGEHSHWEVINSVTGELLWSEDSGESFAVTIKKQLSKLLQSEMLREKISLLDSILEDESLSERTINSAMATIVKFEKQLKELRNGI